MVTLQVGNALNTTVNRIRDETKRRKRKPRELKRNKHIKIQFSMWMLLHAMQKSTPMFAPDSDKLYLYQMSCVAVCYWYYSFFSYELVWPSDRETFLLRMANFKSKWYVNATIQLVLLLRLMCLWVFRVYFQRVNRIHWTIVCGLCISFSHTSLSEFVCFFIHQIVHCLHCNLVGLCIHMKLDLIIHDLHQVSGAVTFFSCVFECVCCFFSLYSFELSYVIDYNKTKTVSLTLFQLHWENVNKME